MSYFFIIQAQMWFCATGQRKKSFNHTHCWEVVKTCKRFQIIPTGPTVVLNETPLHESLAKLLGQFFHCQCMQSMLPIMPGILETQLFGEAFAGPLA
ncbi:transposable element gene [Prunus dulcis]|uniref:Transposable element protein n=1 Tax=Prunus dulcis TaxID=3755 RepID=A0A5H2XUL0_PRUDU|nr:transposable element gene [Prunus dulcis]